MSDEELRPDRHALLELNARLDQIARRRDAGNRNRYDTDDDYRWVLHRLWIAVGNEANTINSQIPRNLNVRNGNDQTPPHRQHSQCRLTPETPAANE